MKLLSQRDPEWAAKKMGASKLTLGRWGCTTTCIAMISDYFGCYKSPAEIAANAHNYTPDGLVLWWNIKFDKMQFVKRVRGTTSELMPEIKEALRDPDRAVLLEVNDGAHWVVAYSTRWFSSDIAVADPWQLPGKVIPCLKTYKNITGAAYYKRVGQPPSPPNTPPVDEQPVVTAKLIKGDQQPHIFYYNGEKKFHFPNWYTFIELGGDMANVKIIPQHLIESLPEGGTITDIKP